MDIERAGSSSQERLDRSTNRTHSTRPIVKPAWITNSATKDTELCASNGKLEEKRTKLAANRAACRAAKHQQAREATAEQVAKESSPRLSEQGKRRGDEIDEPEKRKQKMDEEFKAFVESVKVKLDVLPTKEQFNSLGLKVEQIDRNKENIERNANKLQKHASEMEQLRESVSRIEREQIDAKRGLPARIRETVVASGTRDNGVSHDQFDFARRALRIWPIDGSGREEIRKSVVDFMSGALEMNDVEKNIGIESVERTGDARGGGVVYDEVVVCFADVETRDTVFRRGNKLAGYIDENRRPTCGIRLHITEKMKPAFNVLQRYGFLLKKKHPSLKKYVKFDDYQRSLFIQVRLEEGGEWLNVTPEEAGDFVRENDRRRNVRSCSLRSPTSGRRSSERRGASAVEDAMEEDEDEVFVIPQKPKAWKPTPRVQARKTNE